MYLCYIDESGTSTVPGNTSHFVLAGISMPIWHWQDCDRGLRVVTKSLGSSMPSCIPPGCYGHEADPPDADDDPSAHRTRGATRLHEAGHPGRGGRVDRSHGGAGVRIRRPRRRRAQPGAPSSRARMHTGSTAHPPRRARSASPSSPRFATVPGASSELLSKARARARSSSCRFATPATRRPDSATRSGRYKSEKAKEGDSWRHVKITLEPVNPDFEPVVLTGADEASCR